MEAHTSHVILHMLYLIRKLYSLLNRETVNTNTCQSSIHYQPSTNFIHNFVRTRFNVRWGVGVQVIRLVDYVRFFLPKFGSLSITLWYNALPIITFIMLFTCQTQPNPFMNFSHSYYERSIMTFIREVLNINEFLLTFTCII